MEGFVIVSPRNKIIWFIDSDFDTSTKYQQKSIKQ